MYKSFIKKILDRLVAIILFPIFVIVIIPVFLAIKIEDRGPIFYKSKRIGKGMNEFSMFKFRTMIVDAPDIRNEDGSTFNSDQDPRLTKFGKIIRKASIDELPQLINIILGNMSIIGPRPSPLGDKSSYPKEFFRRYEVLPGITGYNQVLLRNSATLEERIKNDNYYVDHISLELDLKILFMTISTVLFGKNIYRN